MSDIDSRGGIEFARLLAGFRLERGFSQERLADRSGMSVRAIRDLERGQVDRPRRSSIAVLADALALTDAERAIVEQAVLNADRRVDERAQASSLPAARTMPSQLPPDIEDFTGRDAVLAGLSSRLRSRRRGSKAVMIMAVVGKAGVGKTTLAVHAAHQLRSQLPDAQLYVNLRGVEAQALDPGDVLSGFLRALGVESRSIPDDIDERAALYRSLMADLRALVLLDNAADEAQVRPLLPAGARNVVIVTSRSRLAGLPPAEVADLDVFPPEHALELLSKIVGADRLAREPEAATTIVGMCGGLPLALRIVGARLAGKPHWRLQRLADRLNGEHRRLDELAAGDLEVRASVALSYRGLAAVERRAFRLLGLLEVPDFAPWMLSALLDVPTLEAEDIAERLADAQLLDAVSEDSSGQIRYRFHDLLRLFARERLAVEDAPAARRAALERTLQTYFTTAQNSVSQLRLRPPDLGGKTVVASTDGAGTLAGSYQWLAAEHTGLALSLDQAWREGLGRLGGELARRLADFFEVHACWDEWERTYQVALRAARLAGDRRAEASLLCGLGDLRRFQDRSAESVAYFTHSRAIFSELQDRSGEIDSLIGLARAYRRQGRLDESASCFGESLKLCRGLRDRDREAKAMLFFAKVRRQQGRSRDALTLLEGCRDLFYSVGSDGYAAYSDLMIGILCHELGELERAADHLQRALGFAQTLGDPRWEAYALLYLGVIARARGSQEEARQRLEQALAMFEKTGERQGLARAHQVIAALPEGAAPTPNPRAEIP